MLYQTRILPSLRVETFTSSFASRALHFFPNAMNACMHALLSFFKPVIQCIVQLYLLPLLSSSLKPCMVHKSSSFNSPNSFLIHSQALRRRQQHLAPLAGDECDRTNRHRQADNHTAVLLGRERLPCRGEVVRWRGRSARSWLDLDSFGWHCCCLRRVT